MQTAKSFRSPHANRPSLIRLARLKLFDRTKLGNYILDAHSMAGYLFAMSPVTFWFGWFWTAFCTMPEFLGGNWRGACFACICIFLYERRKLFNLEKFENTATLREKFLVAGEFLMDHWKSTFGLWLCVGVTFWIGHTLDLVYRNVDSLSTQNSGLSTTVSANVTACDKEKGDLRVYEATERSRADTLTKQNGDQQNTINNCQTMALSLLKPPPIAINTVEFGFPVTNPTTGAIAYAMVVEGVTNTSISPSDVTLSCDDEIVLLSDNKGNAMGPRLGGVRYTIDSSAAPSDSRTIKIHIGQPAWTPNHPLQIGVRTNASDLKCEIRRE